MSRSEMQDKEQPHRRVLKEEKDAVGGVNEEERKAQGERRGTAH